MAPRVLVRPVRVATGSGDEDGRLVLADGMLVAVLVRLEDPAHGELVGAQRGLRLRAERRRKRGERHGRQRTQR